MQISVINYSKVPKHDQRIDPEFYKPNYLELEELLAKHKSESLGLLCDLYDGPFGSDLLSSSYSDAGVPALRMQNITKEGMPSLNNVEFIPEEEADRLMKHVAYPGEVITTKIGFLGYSTVLPDTYRRYFFRRELTRLVIKDKENLIPNYLATFLNTNYGRSQALRYSTGTTRDRILLINQRHMLIPLLTYSFQLAIDKVIINTHKLLKQSSEKFNEAQQLLLSKLHINNWQPKHDLSFVKNYSDTLLGGRIDAEYYQPKYDEIINSIKNYSNGWEKLENLVSIKKCIEVGSEEYLDEGIPFIRVSNLSTFEITEEKYIVEKLYSELKQHQPEKGEILLSKDATPGIAYYLNEQPKKFIPLHILAKLNTDSGPM